MYKKPKGLSQGLAMAGFVLFFIASTSHAEIFKWVDENGRTHYSENKEGAGKAKSVELKLMSEPLTAATRDSTHQSRQDHERLLSDPFPRAQNAKPFVPPATTWPKSLSNGRADNTDASRCNLARDVLSGAVHHINGAKTDQHDTDIAENDVRLFCR